MVEDLILDASHVPSYDEIADSIREPARGLWEDMNTFIQERYQATPKIAYSKCSGKPGWNVKYQKSGKSLCTLYPEKDRFVTLVVITLDLVPVIEAMAGEFAVEVLEIMRSARPFNGTRWLMIPVSDRTVLENVKQLLLLKQGTKAAR